MPFSLLTDDVLCEVARGNMPLLFALKATCKDARRVLSNWLRMQVSVRLQARPSATLAPTCALPVLAPPPSLIPISRHQPRRPRPSSCPGPFTPAPVRIDRRRR